MALERVLLRVWCVGEIADHLQGDHADDIDGLLFQ